MNSLTPDIGPVGRFYWRTIKSMLEGGLTDREVIRRCYRPSMPLAVSSQLPSVSVISELQQSLGLGDACTFVVGSSKFGFSLRTTLAYDPSRSDLDIAFISPELFAEAIRLSPVGVSPACKQYFDSGMIRPDLVPESNQLVRSWRAKIEELQQSIFGAFYGLSVMCYRDELSFEAAGGNAVACFRAHMGVRRAQSVEAHPFMESAPSDFANAARDDFAMFRQDISLCHVGNSGPYLVNIDHALRELGTLGGRQELTRALRTLIADIDAIVDVDAILLGGSYIRASCANPKDVDGVIFYKCRDGDDAFAAVKGLMSRLRQSQRVGMDFRAVPLDTEPWVAIKTAAFYGGLYNMRREPHHGVGSLLLNMFKPALEGGVP